MVSLFVLGVFVLFLIVFGWRKSNAYNVKKSRDRQRKKEAPKKTLKTAINTPLAKVFITYRDEAGRVTKRNIEPIKADSKGGVRAHCFMRDDLRTFRVDRIQEVVDVSTGECLNIESWAVALGSKPFSRSAGRRVSVKASKSNDIVTTVSFSLDDIEPSTRHIDEDNDGSATYSDTVYGLIPKKGSFDESFFINPKTGRFKFPKYNHLKGYLVKITDDTDYKSDIFDILEPDERKDYSLADFHEGVDSCCFDISASEIEEMVKVMPEKILKPLWRFSVGVDEVISCFDDGHHHALTLTSSEASEIGDELLTVVPVADRNQWSVLTVLELKESCKLAGISVAKKKKQELISELIKAGVGFPASMRYQYKPTDKFLVELSPIVSFYVKEIRRNLDRFHPAVIPHAWDEIIAFNMSPIIESAMREEADSHYWLERMKPA